MDILQKRNDINNLLQDIIDEYQNMYTKHEDNNLVLRDEMKLLREQMFRQSNDIKNR